MFAHGPTAHPCVHQSVLWIPIFREGEVPMSVWHSCCQGTLNDGRSSAYSKRPGQWYPGSNPPSPKWMALGQDRPHLAEHIIICHGGGFSLSMSSYVLSRKRQRWLLFAPIQLDWWSTLSSFLVNGLSPSWSQLGKWPSWGTRNYFFSMKRIIGSGPSGKTFTLLPHWTASRVEIDNPSALFDVFAKMLGPGVRRVQARGHQSSWVSVMYTSLSPFGWSRNQSDMYDS